MSDDAYNYARARDERMAAVRDMIEVEAAQRDGTAFALAIGMIERQAEVAKNMLAECNPADIGSIASYQAEVRCAAVLRNFLTQIITRGKEAEASLLQDPYVRPSYE